MQKNALAPFMVLLFASGCAQFAAPPPLQDTSHLAVEPARSGAAAEADAAVGRKPFAGEAQAGPELTVATELSSLAQPQTVEAAGPPASLWTRVTAGFEMPALDNDLVRQWEQWYAERPEYVDRMIDRSGHFLYYVVEQVEKRDMPTEIALLPMIESAYNPTAYSRAHASGMWQFISSTGKLYGLRQSWWYDGRRDVIEATDAALDYLEKLHAMFGDWQLALAAYNWGEGAVSRAIERNRARGLPIDYESLAMPEETRSYVPKLVAVKNIISDPERFGLEIDDIPNEPYFGTVTVRRHIDVNLAAQLAEIPLDEFKFLNPGHKKPVIKAGEGERIVLPKEKVSTFRANLKGHEAPLVYWKTVLLRRGDNARRLAARYGMTLAELRRVNGLPGRKRVVPGQPLLVRVKAGVPDPELPDFALRPVSLPRAIRAARAKAVLTKGRHAHVRRVKARGGAVRTTLRKPPERKSVHRTGRKPVKAAVRRGANR